MCVFFGIALFSCAGETGSSLDVYISGYESNGTNRNALYWKNGVPVRLTFGTNDSVANGIFVTESDVYVAGVEDSNAGKWVAKYWLSGVPYALSDGTYDAVAYRILVEDGNIHVTGKEYDALDNSEGRYWRNGQVHCLTNGDQAVGIACSGTNVLLCGSVFGWAVYWINDVLYPVTGVMSSSYSLVLSDTNIYVAGNIDTNACRQAVYWENWVPRFLTDGSKDANALAIAVSGEDIHVVGYESNGINDVAMYWKNGVANPLSDGSSNADARAIVVSGKDIYIIGNIYNGSNNVAMLWKNGLPFPLSDGSRDTRATDVFLVP